MVTLNASEGKYLTNGEVFTTSILYDEKSIHIPHVWREVDEPVFEIDEREALLKILEEINK